MIFKSRMPNKLYEGCFFGSECTFSTTNEKVIDKLRKSQLMAWGFIWEVKDEHSAEGDENEVKHEQGNADIPQSPKEMPKAKEEKVKNRKKGKA